VTDNCFIFHRRRLTRGVNLLANSSQIREDQEVPIVIGMMAGLISGSFGVGGGIIIVPGLVVFLQFTQRLSHGTSLLAILPIAAAALVGFIFHDSIDVVYGLFLGLGSIFGALLGTKLLGSISNIWLARIFSAALFVAAARLFIEIPVESQELSLSPVTAMVLVVIGVFIGVMAGLLGIGGGLVLIPILMIFFGTAAPVAKGTSLLVTLIAGTTGTWRNYRNANIDIPVALKIGLAGVPTALIGSQLAMVMSDRVSTVLFALLLLVSAARLLHSART
jgi:uncharacterized membrane protein YfcA